MLHYDKQTLFDIDGGLPVTKFNNGEYKIGMKKKGVEKIGEMIFKVEPDAGQLSVWQKIQSMYKEIFEKNHPNKTT